MAADSSSRGCEEPREQWELAGQAEQVELPGAKDRLWKEQAKQLDKAVALEKVPACQ